jgi:hypothetical protein
MQVIYRSRNIAKEIKQVKQDARDQNKVIERIELDEAEWALLQEEYLLGNENITIVLEGSGSVHGIPTVRV